MRILLSLLALAAFQSRADVRTLEILFQKAPDFQGVVSVQHGGQVRWRKSFGLADRAAARPNDELTHFDIGSVTKQFTASAILKLHEQGRLNIDEPLAKYFRLPAYVQDVTIRQALQHRSGLGYPPDDAPVEWNEPDAKKFYESVMEFAEYDAARPFYYNNIVYSLLAELVHQVSGESFETFVKRELFLFAGLERAGFNTPGSVDLTRSARGYEGAVGHHLAGELPGGIGYDGATGVIMDAPELHAWLLKIHRREIFGALTAELFKTPADGESYALGWDVEMRDGEMHSFSHTGATIGFFSYALFYPRDEVSLVLMSNDLTGGWVLSLAKKVLEGRLTEEDLDEAIEKARGKFKPARRYIEKY